MSISKQELPTDPGSYLLWLYLPKQTRINVGRLGEQAFRRGWYGYCGSAFGPGGLRGRLRHHLQPAQRPHWHIDYLRACAPVKYIWLVPELNAEHCWVSQLAEYPEAQQPVSGFGASDCRCTSHLIFLPRKKSFQGLHAQFDGAKQISVR